MTPRLMSLLYFQFYLVVGYYHVSAEEYDLSWKTPHCVLCLRLTGVVFDIYDGSKNEVGELHIVYSVLD